MSGSKHANEFSADQPIGRLRDDILGRSDFAVRFANAIRGWHGKESLVVGVYGGWGDGKTSFKEMVLDSLRQEENSCPIITEFNPWEWSGQNQLATAFFEEIGKQIGVAATEENTKLAAKKIRFLGNILTTTGKFLDPMAKATAILFPPAEGIVDAAAKALIQSGDFANKTATTVDARSEIDDKSLAQTKRELKAVLNNIEKYILVVLDDVDRLESDQLKLLFQLIKANTDFPNLVFFLLFQRDTVEAYLENNTKPGSGTLFLEKIIQVGLDLPHIPRSALDRFLKAELEKRLVFVGGEASFNWDRWNSLCRSLLGPHFNNLRAIKRFLNAYEFHLMALSKQFEYLMKGVKQEIWIHEVNLVDLFAIEALRIFEPNIYAEILAHKESLSSSGPDVLLEHLEQKEAKNLTKIQLEERHKCLGGFFAQLFPQVDQLSILDRENRICHPEFFDRYFSLAIPEGDLPFTEIKEFFVLDCDRHQSLEKFASWSHRSLLEVACRHLYAALFNADLNELEPYLTMLFSIGDDLSRATNPNATRVVYNLVKNLVEFHVQKGIFIKTLEKAVCASNGLILPALLLTDLRKRIERPNQEAQVPQNHNTQITLGLSVKQLTSLNKIVADRIYLAHTSGGLLAHPEYKTLVGFLIKWLATPDFKSIPTELLIENAVGIAERLFPVEAFIEFSPTKTYLSNQDEVLEVETLAVEQWLPPSQQANESLGSKNLIKVISTLHSLEASQRSSEINKLYLPIGDFKLNSRSLLPSTKEETGTIPLPSKKEGTETIPLSSKKETGKILPKKETVRFTLPPPPPNPKKGPYLVPFSHENNWFLQSPKPPPPIVLPSRNEPISPKPPPPIVLPSRIELIYRIGTALDQGDREIDSFLIPGKRIPLSPHPSVTISVPNSAQF
jgi:KAP family P-loop domain